jgi:multiple sugar transport system substrate-binding protein
VSLAGGSSLVLFRGSDHEDAAWKLIEFLAEAGTQKTFYDLSGDLPARVVVWEQPVFASDRRLAAFGAQLRHVVPTPKIPEWEQIAMALQHYAEVVIRGGGDVDSTLARLDRRVDQILEKRRWLHAHGRLSRPEVDS